MNDVRLVLLSERNEDVSVPCRLFRNESGRLEILLMDTPRARVRSCHIWDEGRFVVEVLPETGALIAGDRIRCDQVPRELLDKHFPGSVAQ
jgi:hypothetical protein